MKPEYQIEPAEISFRDFEEELFKVSRKKCIFTFDEINFYPSKNNYSLPGMEIRSYYFEAAFIHLSDCWIEVPEFDKMEKNSDVIWYDCAYSVIKKRNVNFLEHTLNKAIESTKISQKEVEFLRAMIQNINESE